MILDFSVTNYGPFKERATLSLHATALKALQENIVPSDRIKGGLLTSAVVFGPNASGKSYLHRAILALRSMLEDAYADGYHYPWYEPFRLNKACLGEPVTMEIRLVIDDVLYDYSISYDASSIASESLYCYPRGRRAKVFLRNGPRDGYEGGKKRIIAMTSGSSSYLAVAAKFNDETCRKVRDAVISMVFVDSSTAVLAAETCRFASEDLSRKQKVIEALNTTDFGIADFEQTDVRMDMESIRGRIPPELYEKLRKNAGTVSESRIVLRHSFRKSDVGDEGLVFPYEIESSGTKSMLGLIGPVIDVLQRGSVLIIDELGSNLHPLLTRWIVQQFSGDRNPNHAQLIANTHEIGLIDQDILRRDQIWLVDKDRESGASEIYSLADFDGLKDSTDILKGYLLGRYNAIPFIRSDKVVRWRTTGTSEGPAERRG